MMCEQVIGALMPDQRVEFMDHIMAQVELPESVNLAVTWRDTHWLVKFFSEASEDTPWGASKEMVLWLGSNLGAILVQFHINENNERFGYSIEE